MERIKGKIPKRRFEGFTDDWEQRKLLGCIQKITDFRGRTPKKLGMDWSESGYLALSALNVKDGYIDFTQDVHYGNQELYDKWMTGNELHKGQVLFTTEAPMGNVAQVPDNRQYILSQRTIAFDVKDDYITENFLATVLRTPRVFEDLTALSSGGTAKGVSQKSLAAVDITIPTDLKEQEYIARYFANFDHLITLHQRKLEKLKNIKKSYLSEMFPQEDEKKPKRRFKGFTDDWEQRKFGELADYKKGPFGSAITKDMFVEKSETSVKVYEQQNAINRDWTLERYFLPQSYVFSNLKSFEVHGGDVIVSCAGTIGEIYELPENAEVGVINQALMRVRVNENIIQKKMFIILFSNMIESFTQSHSNGSAIKNIPPFSDLKPMEVLVPKRDEQILLADYFAKLDYLITLHQRKLEKLKHIKQAYLNEMFV